MKIRGWGYLAGAGVFCGVIAINLVTGVAHSRISTDHRATDPDSFWMDVSLAGLYAAGMLFLFFLAQAGDGWNDDG